MYSVLTIIIHWKHKNSADNSSNRKYSNTETEKLIPIVSKAPKPQKWTTKLVLSFLYVLLSGRLGRGFNLSNIK